MIGKWNGVHYQVNIRHDISIHENLGAVMAKNDGRWDWKRFKSKVHTNWKGDNDQGVTNTEEEAKNKVIEGWKDE